MVYCHFNASNNLIDIKHPFKLFVMNLTGNRKKKIINSMTNHLTQSMKTCAFKDATLIKSG